MTSAILLWIIHHVLLRLAQLLLLVLLLLLLVGVMGRWRGAIGAEGRRTVAVSRAISISRRIHGRIKAGETGKRETEDMRDEMAGWIDV